LTASEAARKRFQAVVLPHLDEAYSFAKGFSRNGADAEDIVQDACLRALAALETQQVEQPRAWLLTIVRNVALTFLTRKNAAASVDADIGDLERDGLLQAHDPSPDAEARLIAADETESLRRGLADLPLALRETLTLRAIHGLSYRDISTATEAPIGTVMSRLARARAHVKAVLEGERPALRRVK